MGSHPSCIVPLAEAARAGDGLVGGKAARLGALIEAGFRVPRGFCITTAAYEQFIAEAGLSSHIAMELGRRPLDAMRWEELWDTALRIRSAVLRADVPDTIAATIRRALADHVGGSAVAVRSSAPEHVHSRAAHDGLASVSLPHSVSLCRQIRPCGAGPTPHHRSGAAQPEGRTAQSINAGACAGSSAGDVRPVGAR